MTTGAHALAGPHVERARRDADTRRRGVDGTVVIFLLVFGVQLAFGVWMAARGFRWGDAFYRSASAQSVLYSSDPKLANVGFVWMPLVTLLNLPWVALYSIWPGVVASGFASAATSAVAGGATAALLLFAARRFGLPRWLGWAFALLVSVNPMVFLYSGSGMAEGVTAPFLIGALCCLTLFWHSGERRWIAAAGIALGLGFAAAYEAVPFGAALFGALAAGVFRPTEARPSAPQGPARATEGLGFLLLVPSVFIGILWIAGNAAIMGDPLFFAKGAYGYSGYQEKSHTAALGMPDVTGDALGAVAMVGERMWPFLIPLIAVLAVRAIDRRLWRLNTLCVVLVGLSVPFGLIAPMAFSGSAMGYLRYLIYPLFAAAGWGLYEISISARRRRAVAVVLAGWALSIPACLWIMTNPGLGLQESRELRAVAHGATAQELGFKDPVDGRAPVAAYLEEHALANGATVLLDSFQGAAVAAQVRPRYAHGQLVMTFDRRFDASLADPYANRIDYVLVPDPRRWPQDAILTGRPRLWSGKEPGFTLVRTIHTAMDLPEDWRLFAVGPGARVLSTQNGGSG
jgi:Dolichyl-phosphate-mannose-protein mannosyltransferase